MDKENENSSKTENKEETLNDENISKNEKKKELSPEDKLREIKALLPKNIKIHSTSDYDLKSPKENGKTFRENSLIKASFFSKKSKQICMSDDSGLEINVLNNQPGIYSARWGGKNNNFDLAIKKVFKN